MELHESYIHAVINIDQSITDIKLSIVSANSYAHTQSHRLVLIILDRCSRPIDSMNIHR